MGWDVRARHGWFKAVSAADKLVWGARVVGVRRTVIGLGRLVSLRLRRPPRAMVRLSSGAVMEFAVPGQVAPALVLFQDLIDPEFALLTELSRPEWVVLDVGAAIGQFSIFAARLPSAVVHAFEPSPANLTTLAGNLARNAVSDRVVVHPVAVGEFEGDASFSTADNAYMSGLVTDPGDSGARVTVAVRRLTALVDELGLDRVDVLKINVAGYEPGVLAGAEPFLRAGRADVLVLLIGDASVEWYERCADWGYRFFFYHPKQGRLLPVTSFDVHTLRHPAWPARHLIGVHADAISRGVLRHVPVAETTGERR
jgi:FkbM family methyltransferase